MLRGKLTIETRLANITSEVRHKAPYGPLNYVALMVPITGGMGSQDQDACSTRFFSTKSPDKGTGLGLAVVYGSLNTRRFHPYCTARSQRVRFSLYFPPTSEVSREKEQPGQKMIPAARNHPIAEDDAVIAEHEIGAENIGYTVIAAKDGKEAVDLFLKIMQDLAGPSRRNYAYPGG
jgi:hypothetical protein